MLYSVSLLIIAFAAAVLHHRCGAFNLFNSRKLIEEGKSLIFPPTTPTRTQFICGIGIPVEDLAYESITSGYVIKAEYFLPTKAAELHYNYIKPMSIHGSRRRKALNVTDSSMLSDIKSRHNDLSKYRWLIYKAVETMAEKAGFVGKACMLRAICEYAEMPFHYESGLLGDIFHIVLTPTASVDDIVRHTNNEYFQAEFLGRNGAPCSVIFKECKRSFLNNFSHIVEMNNFL